MMNEIFNRNHGAVAVLKVFESESLLAIALKASHIKDKVLRTL